MSVTSLTSYFNTSSFGDTNTYTRNQKELALTLDSAAHELFNWKSLIAMSGGGAGFEVGQLAARALLGATPALCAVPFLTNAFTFVAGAITDTGLTGLIHQALENVGGEENETFFERLTSQGGVRLMGLVGIGQSFVVMQLLMGLASVSREMVFSRGDPVWSPTTEGSPHRGTPTFLSSMIQGLQCHFGSGMFGYFTHGGVTAVEQRIKLRTKNMGVGAARSLSRVSSRDGRPQLEGAPGWAPLLVSTGPGFSGSIKSRGVLFAKAVKETGGSSPKSKTKTSKRMLPGPWKTTTVVTEWGSFEVTHRATHDPRLLVETLHQAPQKVVSKREVFQLVGGIKKRELVGRKFLSIDEAREKFGLVVTAFHLKTAVEVPIALVINEEKPRAPQVILSLWKQNAKNLSEYLLDPKVIKGDKYLVCRRVVLHLRRLHDRGFLHGDPHDDNVVVSRRGHVYLVDFDDIRVALCEGTTGQKTFPEKEMEKLLYSFARTLVVCDLKARGNPIDPEILWLMIDEEGLEYGRAQEYLEVLKRITSYRRT